MTDEEIQVFSLGVEKFSEKILGEKPSKDMWIGAYDYCKKRTNAFTFSDWDTDNYRVAYAEALVQWLKSTRNFLSFVSSMRPPVSPFHIEKVMTMGDSIYAGAGGIVVNRSVVQNALNKIQGEYDKETADIFAKVTLTVDQSNNVAAIHLWESFGKQLTDDPTNKTALRSLWDGLLKILPAVGAVAGATAGIAKLLGG